MHVVKEWARDVRGRIEFVNDLHAADALYHQTCSVNFRTGKTVPLLFSPSSTKKALKRGRPVGYPEAFQQIVADLRNHEDEQITGSDLLENMNGICGDAYSAVYMKKETT